MSEDNNTPVKTPAKTVIARPIMLVCLVLTWLVVFVRKLLDIGGAHLARDEMVIFLVVFLLPWVLSLITAIFCYINKNAEKAGKIGLFLCALAILVWFMKLST
ncbi:MAG: hypothetical protein LBI31_03475 [Zoogloeaceae bacterium]|jgi:uncharacterized membrane protein YhaH (DUF805 family)|nr:hypothetical protein [Zoogloeaceae bacterium]